MRRLCLFAMVFVGWCMAASAQDTAQQIYDQGLTYHNGDGVTQNYAKAAQLFQQAADAGFAPAKNHLGRYYFEGLGVARDVDAALRLLQDAATSGVPEYQFDFAKVLETDPATVSQAAELYAQSAQAGLIDAAVSLGVLYQDGRGVVQDFDRARALYEPAAAAGHPRALNNLGLLYVRGQGVEQDYARAAQLFTAAGEQGLAQALKNLGVLYENGFGVPLDEARATELYRAAGQGVAKAPVSYVYDARLVPVTEASQHLAAQAVRGDPVAQFQAAWLILQNPNSEFDALIEAAAYLQNTAAQGHGPSMLNLGLLYMRGLGVPQDYVLGHKWLLLAQSAGVDAAGAALAETRAQLTAGQINQAQDMAMRRQNATTD